MLADRYLAALPHLLLPREAWRPFPTATEREPWQALDADLRASLVHAGERYLDHDWPVLPATLFMEYRRQGNRSRYEGPHFARRSAMAALVVAECVEGEGRFLDDLINGLWALCEESFWGVPAHNYVYRFESSPLPDTAIRAIDLFAAETGALLAWLHYLLGPQLDAVHPVITDRLRREVRERIIEPYRTSDRFGWLGLQSSARVNNWNPWCNGNCLTCVLLLEDDSDRRVEAVGRGLRSIDRFFDAYLPDGGCDEGTSYWGHAGASLFDCLELLHSATGGAIDLFDDPLVANMGRFLYRAHIADDWFVNFADGGARVIIDADLVYRYGRRIGDSQMMGLGAFAHRRRLAEGPKPVRFDPLYRKVAAVFNHAELTAAPADPPLVREAWLDGIQMLTAREREGSTAGLFVAAKGGHNAESHNHNDVGQFVVYLDGQPVLVDVGVGAYTAQTFSSRRYEIWTMQSAWHNLPTINGVQQAPGLASAAAEVSCTTGDDGVELRLNLAGAYPAEAGLERWDRTVALFRGAAPRVEVTDTPRLGQPGEVVWSLVTPREPQVGDGRLLLPGDRDAVVTFAPELQASVERVEVDDARLTPIWGDHLYRVLLRAPRPITSGTWTMVVTAG